MEALTGVAEPNISPWRRRVCGDLMMAFDFATTAAIGNAATESRPARPLPYQPNANARFDERSRTMTVALGNDGVESVHFAVHSAGERMPRRYDVSRADGTVADSFSLMQDSRHDIAVHGPNGFLRRFSGSGPNPAIAIFCDYDVENPHDARVRLTASNSSDDAVELRIVDNKRGVERTLRIDSGERAAIGSDATLCTNGWYDLTVTLDGDPDFLWRFAGHIETGNASVSG
jgi:phospholipase C